MRGFLIHLTTYVVVIIGLATFNLITNPAHPWFFWVLCGWGVGVAVHDLVLLMKFRRTRVAIRPTTSDEVQIGV
jgi:hypothetical protein